MILLDIGKKGFGKSTHLRALLSRSQAGPGPKPLVFADDPQGTLAVPAAHVFASIERWRASKNVPVLSVFRGVHPNHIAKLACEVKDVTLVLDEIDLACHDKKWAQSPELSTPECVDGDWVKRVVHYGRHLRVSLWGSCRRLQNVPEDLISQADIVNIFRVSRKAVYDLQAIKTRFGEDAARQATTLALGEFLAFDDDDD